MLHFSFSLSLALLFSSSFHLQKEKVSSINSYINNVNSVICLFLCFNIRYIVIEYFFSCLFLCFFFLVSFSGCNNCRLYATMKWFQSICNVFYIQRSMKSTLLLLLLLFMVCICCVYHSFQ